jgi:DNA-binding NtrC family response regulator
VDACLINNYTMEPLVKNKKKPLKVKDNLPMSVFLVDDDLSYLYPLGFYLQRNSEHKIFCYRSGEECLENLHQSPDVIILDFNLNPEKPNTLNGLDVLKDIKARRPQTVVIMLSGRDTFQGVVDSLKLGAYTYVIKDIEALASIKKILDKLREEK